MAYIIYLLVIVYLSNKSLECYNCLNAVHNGGSLEVASMWTFVSLHNTTSCDNVEDNSIPLRECPTDDGNKYSCGYIYVQIKAWAHRVQELNLTIAYRDCLTGKKEWSGTCFTIDEKRLIDKLWEIVPHSIISLEPYGRGCFCTRSGCYPVVDPEDVYIGAKYCKSDEYDINGECVDWYVPLVIALDAFIIFLLLAMLCCCCCPCCLVAKRRRKKRKKYFDDESVYESSNKKTGTFWVPFFGLLNTPSTSIPTYTYSTEDTMMSGSGVQVL